MVEHYIVFYWVLGTDGFKFTWMSRVDPERCTRKLRNQVCNIYHSTSNGTLFNWKCFEEQPEQNLISFTDSDSGTQSKIPDSIRQSQVSQHQEQPEQNLISFTDSDSGIQSNIPDSIRQSQVSQHQESVAETDLISLADSDSSTEQEFLQLMKERRDMKPYDLYQIYPCPHWKFESKYVCPHCRDERTTKDFVWR